MNEQVAEQVLERLDALASQLGVTAGYLWEVLVAQQPIHALYSFTALVLVLVLAWGWWKVFAPPLFVVQVSPVLTGGVLGGLGVVKDYPEEGTVVLSVITGFTLGVFLVVALVNALSILPRLLNPEYYALKEVLKVLQ